MAYAGGGSTADLKHVSLPEAVARALRQRILNNELPAETRLVEANLAAEFRVSRGTVRDAMKMLRAEGLIEIVPRHYSVVTRMSAEDAEDVCYARCVLEEASLVELPPSRRRDLVRDLRLAFDHMVIAAKTDDVNALVESDTKFHEILAGLSGRRRLMDLWHMLNSQMGALMRAEIDRQGISLMEAVERHRTILDAVADGDLDRLRAEVRTHYLGPIPPRHDGEPAVAPAAAWARRPPTG